MSTADDLRKLAQKARRSQARADQDRAERNALIYDLKTGGEMKQSDICRAADLTREHVARIVDAEGKRRRAAAEEGGPSAE